LIVASEVDGWGQVEWRSGAAGGGRRKPTRGLSSWVLFFASATPVFIILLKIVDITKQLSSSATFYSHVTTKI
jgi:hypothetical protein